MSRRSTDIAVWLRQQLALGGAEGLVAGLSGGIDSAVVARLCQIAAPGNVVGVIMPCHSDPADEADARLVAEHFGIPVLQVDLAASFDRLVGELDAALAPCPPDQLPPAAAHAARLRSANVTPRLRMTTLYFVATALNYLVAGTGNRSELTIGYFTKHGDGGGDVLPIGSLLKSEVRLLARELEVPPSIIDKAPSAGLWTGQTDEAEMGFTYADLENYLANGPDAVSPALTMRIERLVRSSEHKRSLARMPDV